nr:hypothetical protein [Mesorhizobium sp.]
MIKIGLSVVAATVLLVTRAWSADNSGVDQAPQTDVDVVIELGLGGIIQPEYEGSKDYEIWPWPVIGFGYFAIPGLFAIGSPEAQAGGFAIGPSFTPLIGTSAMIQTCPGLMMSTLHSKLVCGPAMNGPTRRFGERLAMLSGVLTVSGVNSA